MKREPDIITTDYDGSYELIQFLTKQYDGMFLDNIDYKDLDSLYLSIIGTWKVGFNKKKQKIMESNLTIDKKKESD